MAGQRVRITAPGALTPTRQAGRLISIRGDTILMQPDGGAESLAVPRAAITDMEVSHGRHLSTGSGIIIGALVGGVAGAVAVAGTPGDKSSCPPQPRGGLGCGVGQSIDSALRPAAEIAAGVVGMIVGGAVGALIGHAHESENWESVSPGEKLAVTPTLTLGRTPAAGVRIALAW